VETPAVDKKTVAAIERHFPGTSAVLQRELTESESFRGLCRDYLACQTALARWQETDSDEGRLRSKEYSELLAELTEEIETRLHALET
jgi:hypothetical protein